MSRVLAVLGLSAFLSIAVAGEPSAEPILRLDTGTHTTAITSISVDRQGRYLATGSADKTIRIWDLKSGTLIRVLRPPIGDGMEGQTREVAISPDGEQIAAAGYSGREWDGDYWIYVFSRSSGQMIQRLGGLPSPITRLAWSRDAQYLAAGTHRNGIRLYRMRDFKLVGEDTDCKSDSRGLDFDAGNRLATTCYDGYVRLYSTDDNGLSLKGKERAPGGQLVRTIRFTPNGSQIAVTYNIQDSGIDILDSKTLQRIFSPDLGSLKRGRGYYGLAWSIDGQTLFAAGRVDRRVGEFLLRMWSDVGRGRPVDTVVAKNTVFDLQPLADGGVVFGAADPAWGVVDAQGKRILYMAPATADLLRGNPSGLQLDAKGIVVKFSYEVGGVAPARFRLADRQLETQIETQNISIICAPKCAVPLGIEGSLREPITDAPGLRIESWRNSREPKLNGKLIKLQFNEESRSIAIAPDLQSILVGSGWNLWSFSPKGESQWRIAAPGTAWAVNFTGDGKIAVAAFGDSTIRWFRAKDGQELLALFLHADRKRWVLWTPSGYYEASPGAEELLGWHLNRGKDQAADFFPASRFRDRFYRPDVIAKVLEAGSETEALRLANAETGRKTQVDSIAQILPPVVQILSPNEGIAVSTRSITLKYNVRAPSDAPVTGLRARVNGLAVSLPEARILTLADAVGVREITLPIPPQDSEIQLFAENRNGMSVPAILRVFWAQPKLPSIASTAADDVLKPKLYMLVVGVSKYKNPQYDLEFAAKDARDFADVFMRQKGQLYRDVDVRFLVNAEATKDDVLDGLEWLKRQVTSRDIGILFLAGHGVNDATNNYYFLPHNADADRLLRTGVAYNDIKLTLGGLAGKALFFIDTCHSGNVLGGAKSRGGTDINAVVSDLASAENGVVVFAASTGRQLSQESAVWGNGAFTKAVVEGLNGQADFRKSGTITHKGLDFYVAERVKELTKGQQSPVSIAPQGVTDFPIAIVRK